ncbi:DUF6069 family protein [Arthrobacter sp. JCM 19049]|uniref:DUF6069 family protein n=1 Tax=Arthrobacter sp. JCM 19049 TaxID=1460643 RepID=UPI0006D2750B|nr:DUF6069 family protein [Arthrobacter sp. JCM 19049]
MGAEIQYKSPFNFVQVLILALGAAYLNVIVFFVSESAGGSMVFNGGLVDHVQFAQVLGFTLAPIMILGLLTFAIGSAKPGFCRIAQWLARSWPSSPSSTRSCTPPTRPPALPWP